MVRFQSRCEEKWSAACRQIRKRERQHDSEVTEKKMLLQRWWQKGRKVAKVAKGVNNKG